MRLLIIINTTNIGGTEHATLRFIKLLMKRDDIRVTVMSPRPKGIGAVLFREIGFEVIGLPHCGPYGILSNFLLTRRIWTLNPDCIWVVGTSVSSILSTLLSFAKIKVLSIHYHHTGIHGSMFWQLFYVLISRIFDVITYPSNFIRNEAMTFAHYISKQSFVLRNPLINIIMKARAMTKVRVIYISEMLVS
jgi:hypothetical protein